MQPNVSRPHLHFTPRSGWMNDPHGLTFHRGRYHLFFQYVAGRTTWGPEQSWGHATSDDLLHWTEGDVVLAPGDGDHGVWSGSIAVPQSGPAALFYTSAREGEPQIGRARIAHPEDESWTRWRKGEVVAGLPEGVEATALRDPFVMYDSGWRMILGAGLADGTAAALTYVSDDLTEWTYDGVLAERHRSATDPWTGAMWECPQLVRVAGRWVLIVSAWSTAGPGNEAYAIGDLADGRFVAESWSRLSYGPSSYAAAVFTDADGDPCLIHWMRGVADPAGRWVGAHSLPQRLEFVDGCLIVRPHPTVAQARTGEPRTIRDAAADLADPCDLEWTLDDPLAAASLTIAGADGLQARLDAGAGNLTVRVGDESWEMPIGGPELRVIIDGPTLEIYTSAGTMGAPIGSAPVRTIAAAGAGGALAFHLE